MFTMLNRAMRVVVLLGVVLLAVSILAVPLNSSLLADDPQPVVKKCDPIACDDGCMAKDPSGCALGALGCKTTPPESCKDCEKCHPFLMNCGCAARIAPPPP